MKLIAGLTVAGAIALGAGFSPAQASSMNTAVTADHNAKIAVATEDMSARKRRRVVVRRYYAPTYYGYYGPTYYERPYARPVAPWWGVGGWW